MLAEHIGRVVSAARGRAGMSVEALAEQTALDAKLLASVERGEKLVSTAKLDRIAATLGLDAFELYRGVDLPRGLTVMPRHASRPDFRERDLRPLRQALERATTLGAMSALGGRQPISFLPEAPGVDAAQAGYHCARRVRVALENLTGPIDRLDSLLPERFHVPVLWASLETPGLFAVAVRSRASGAAAIVLNAPDGIPADSQTTLVERVSICHELCHVLFDAPRDGDIDVVLDDPPKEGKDKSPIEQRAGAFAAELLIPLFGLKEEFGEPRGVDTDARADAMVDLVRSRFRTPAEIAVNHLYNHSYIAHFSEFREHLIDRAHTRSVVAGGSPHDRSAWRLALIQRIREANELGLVSDGGARAALELQAGDSLPWDAP